MAELKAVEILERAREFSKCADFAVQNSHFNACAICCYVALFWAARAALAREGIKRPMWGHSELRSKFSDELISNRGRYPTKFKTWLTDAFKLRNLAQYQLESPQAKRVRRMADHVKVFLKEIEKELSK